MNEDRWKEVRSLANAITDATSIDKPTQELQNDLARASLSLAALLLTNSQASRTSPGGPMESDDVTLQLRPGAPLPGVCGSCPFLGRRAS